MAVTGFWYAQAPAKMMNKEIDLDSDTIKAMLLTSSYTPNRATHAYKSDLSNEVTGTGYTAGGATLASCTVSYVAANSWATARANSTTYALGQVVRPATGNTYLYQAISAGTSAGSIPTYPTTLGGTVTDGSVVWMCVAQGAVVFDADNPTWSSSTITARYVVFYDATPGSDATRPLIAYQDFGADQASTNGPFTFTIDPTGIVYILMP